MKLVSSFAIFGVFTVALAGCASTDDLKPAVVDPPQARWTAYGFLSPGRTDDPEFIGMYLTREACDAAVEDWMSRQVVGNPVTGECLPIDRR